MTLLPAMAFRAEDLDARLSEYGTVERVPATKVARDLVEARASNVVLLGCLSKHLNLPEEAWVEIIRKSFPQKHVDLNLKAFQEGKRLGQGQGI